MNPFERGDIEYNKDTKYKIHFPVAGQINK